ncbi:MAG: IS4 family transposase, partial [Bacteroidota bacterium]
LELRLVTDKDQQNLWNGYVEKYHYLSYKRPFGPHLRYFITSRKLQDQYLGCLLFAPAALSLKPRDEWIGWSDADRKKRINLVINNSRFLIFPWINIECLASRALSMAAQQVATDWHSLYGYRPVLLETYVDPEKYDGTCYKAANWQHIGNSAGRERRGKSRGMAISKKYIYMYPLTQNFRSILRNEIFANPQSKSSSLMPLIDSWTRISEIINEVTSEYDKTWQKRDRIINSMMLVLLIFRVLLSKNSQGYHTTIINFWDSCHKSKLSLPQKKPISPSSFSEARNKLDENIFKTINKKIIFANEHRHNQFRWKGHRLFAVDGSKINLPRSLIRQGFTKSSTANYPQGLLSTLYQLNSKLPYDFNLSQHHDERKSARTHLSVLESSDIVVYDRGYFSYKMLHEHIELGIHAIFRLPKNSYTRIDNFINQSTDTDTIVIIEPNDHNRKELKLKYPELIIKPLRMRLIKYTYEDTEYYLGTTLTSNDYTISDFSDVYHSRWGIEELYKISKKNIEIEDFHGRSERGVRQELYAHFVLITISRLFANQSEFEKNIDPNAPNCENINSHSKATRPLRSFFKVNFKNCLSAVEADLETLLLAPSEDQTANVIKIVNRAMAVTQKVRPQRSYPRISMKPDTRWRPGKNPKSIKQKIEPHSIIAATI